MRVQANIALYVGNEGVWQNDLNKRLRSVGIELHYAFSAQVAKRNLCDHKYSLLLLKFEHIRKHVFDLCADFRQAKCNNLILVLMDNPHPIIERTLFDFGVDDVVVGKQTLPSVLKFRIKKRIFINESPLQNTDRILFKGGVEVILNRKEVWFNKSCRMIGGVMDKLFRYFLENPHRVISRTELATSHIWDNSVCPPNREENGKAIDMAVTRLRRIIEPNPSDPQIIITVHKTGWMLARDAVILSSPTDSTEYSGMTAY